MWRRCLRWPDVAIEVHEAVEEVHEAEEAAEAEEEDVEEGRQAYVVVDVVIRLMYV